jgi:N-acetylglucosaminyldiphosphoundecaprenol N-acetyl-beta-D-mannosaminyltransferase
MSVAALPRFEPDTPPPAPPETVTLLGLDFAAISEVGTIDFILGELAQGRGGTVCTVNVDILRQYQSSAEVRELLAEAALVVADGMPLVWASIVQGTPLPERVAGSTLTWSLSRAAAEAGASVFLLGGNPGAAKQAARTLVEHNPGLHVAGTLCPPVGFERETEWMGHIRETLIRTRPDIVFVGLGFPKQERLIATLRDDLPDSWFIGCGVSFSFVSGEFARAPMVMQRLGLEWIHRLVQEPRRLYRRYLISGVPFVLVLLSSSLSARSSKPVQLGP